jgi:hypothetical protein
MPYENGPIIEVGLTSCLANTLGSGPYQWKGTKSYLQPPSFSHSAVHSYAGELVSNLNLGAMEMTFAAHLPPSITALSRTRSSNLYTVQPIEHINMDLGCDCGRDARAASRIAFAFRFVEAEDSLDSIRGEGLGGVLEVGDLLGDIAPKHGYVLQPGRRLSHDR